MRPVKEDRFLRVRMSTPRGRYLPLSLPRRWIADLLHFARQVPTVPVQRQMKLAAVRQSRSQAGISWPAIFLKAFALTAQRHPELRRAWIHYPWARLYEHPFTVASVAVERDYAGEPAVFFGQIRNVEGASLTWIDRKLRDFKQKPIESIGVYRRAIRFAGLPRWLRRLAWWISLHWSGPKRAKRMGTMGLSVYAGLGAASLHPLSPLSFVLNYGVLDEAGGMDVRLIYDHRVADGAVMARALQTLEATLRGQIQEELAALSPHQFPRVASA
jgi:hypothetical protein